MFSRLVGAAFAVAVALAGTSVSAATFSYILADHPFGSLSPGGTNATSGPGDQFAYGLRLDNALPDGNTANNTVGQRIFSFNLPGAGATLTYDDVALTATISGTMVLNDSNGAPVPPNPVFNVTYTMTNLTSLPGTPGFFSMNGANGVGSISNGIDTFVLGSKAKSGIYFELDDDGHRIPNDTTTIVGRGWVNPFDDNGNQVGGTNDFLFIARPDPNPGTVVPLPAAGWMLIAGVAGLGYVGRRKRKAA
ncbi:MAG: VPLPA-CTERM sorting domain-containing protein [Pseudomonadota bacterium]